jgi:pyruvate,water dikinase
VTLALSEDAAFHAGPRVAGGKGWNLGRLARYGFPVPDGFVLAADAYRAVMRAVDVVRPEDVHDALRKTSLPGEIADALDAGLHAMKLRNAAVAVRSSATAEDGRAASFAGVHASVLDVRGTDAALDAVRTVYASLWTPQALAYRRRFRIADDDVACAVVVCRMVPARAAGVAFTCDPKTGRRDLVVINAAAGRGDAVVSGAVTPEEIGVALAMHGLAIESRTGPRVLDDAQALALTRLAIRVAAALGDSQDPQDIEWAFDGERFHLLQARPVTRVPTVAFPGAEHLPVVWSSANIKDAVPFVPTTMAWTCIQPALRFMLWTYPEAVGYRVPKGTEVVRRFGGRAYFDATALQWMYYDCFGVAPVETNRSMGGHHAELAIPDTHPLRGRAGRRRLGRRLRAVRLLQRLPKTLPAIIDGVFRDSKALMSVDVAALSNAQLLEQFELISRQQLAYGGPFILAAASLAWHNELEKALDALAPGRGIALASALVAGSGDVVSAAHGVRLFDVADAVADDPAARAWMDRDPFDSSGWRALPEASPFRRALRDFLAEFGHRAVYEAELATPRWNEDPAWLIEQVRAIRAGHGRQPQNFARERRAGAERDVRTLTWLRRPYLAWLTRRAREAGALRERAKSALVVQLEPLRRALLEVGRRLVAAGIATAPDDVFHLASSDVEAWLRGDWDGHGLRALVADRKAQTAAWEGEHPPDVIRADGGAVARAPIAPRGDGGAVLIGLAVSGGRASGPACVIRHPADGHRLRQGDVLVAPSTDPGWTPLFLRASAIVVEVGGMLSHGSIVAREYGLPAVVNVPGLLEVVKNGDALIVDGDTGTIARG